MRAYALISARAGSKGLPDTNILPVAGHPLLAYSVAFGRSIPVERVLLSTDSPRHAEIGRAYGAELPGLRGPAASGDTAMEEDILAELDIALPAHGIPLPDIWVWLKPTCPFRDPDAVAKAIGVLRDRPDVDAVRIASALERPMYQADAEGWLKPAPADWAPAGLEVFRHAGGRMRQRVLALPAPHITTLAADSADGQALIGALLESWPRPAAVTRHIHLPPSPPPLATPAPSVAQLHPHFGRSDTARQIEILVRLIWHETSTTYCSTAANLARARPDLLRAAAEAVLAQCPVHPAAMCLMALAALRLGDAAAAHRALRRHRDIASPPKGFDGRGVLRASLLDPGAEPAARAEDWARHGADSGALSACSYAVQRAVAEGRAPDLASFATQLQAERAALRAQLERQAAAGDAASRQVLGLLARLTAARSVAIVGNGESLRGSAAAARIEAHDMVLRCNYPVLAGFEEDVGTRTDLMLFDRSIRGRLGERTARHPSYSEVPALCFDGTGPAPGEVGPPAAPPGLMRLFNDLAYDAGTTGFRTVLLVALILERPTELFGFTFFHLGGQGDYFEPAAPEVMHEMGYERWFVERVLPVLRPQVRWIRPG